MELIHLFKPVNIKPYAVPGLPPSERVAVSVTKLHELKDEPLNHFNVAILGIDEGANSPNNNGCALGPNFIRTYLFGLKKNSRSLQILDLGNALGNSINDKFIAVQTAVEFFAQYNIPVLVLGGSQDFSVPIVKGLAEKQQSLNLTFIDAVIDSCDDADDFSSQNYLKPLLPNSLESVNNISFLGLQKYFMSEHQIAMTENKWCNHLRLGELRDGHIKETEPFIREADFVSFDVAAIRHSDMPSQSFPMANGFSAFEACQMAWYAGMSDQNKVFGLFEVNPEKDPSHAGLSLAAQIVWFYLEGIAFRVNDYPCRAIDTYKIYHIDLQQTNMSLRFFNNPISSRWWIEIDLNGTKFVRACSERDYLLSSQNEIPDRWWKYISENQ